MGRRQVSAAVGVSVLLVLGGACSSSDSGSNATSTSTTSTTASSRSMQVDTPDGQVSLSLDGKLPPNWPSGFPVPEGATPSGSGSLGGSDRTVMVAAYSTSMSGADVFSFYESSTELTVENPTSGGIGDAFAGRLTLTGTYEGSVTVVGGSSATIVVVLKSPGAGSGGTVVPPSGTTPGSTPGTTART